MHIYMSSSHYVQGIHGFPNVLSAVCRPVLPSNIKDVSFKSEQFVLEFINNPLLYKVFATEHGELFAPAKHWHFFLYFSFFTFHSPTRY